MDKVIQTIDKFARPRYEEDFVDRLNFKTTAFIFATASALISYKTYFGSALLCWTPVQFRAGWDEYTNDFCLIENTYFMPPVNKSLPDDIRVREDRKLSYYQWVPFVLMMQAFMFVAPHVFWRMLNWMSGVQLRAVVTMAKKSLDYSKTDFGGVSVVATHLENGLKMSRGRFQARGSSNPFGCLVRTFAKRSNCYISFCYFIMKALFLTNLIIQLAILNFFLDIPTGDSLTWGIKLLFRLFSGTNWDYTGIFPRVTVCDFEIRELGNLHRWSVQCVLPLNMFNEKVYVFLWFWLHAVLVATFTNCIIWLLKILNNERRRLFIEDLVSSALAVDTSAIKAKSHDSIMRQMYEDLGWDGVLILHIIQSNAGELPCTAIVKELYGKYVEKNGAVASKG